GPAHMTFATPVTIGIHYDAATYGAGDDLFVVDLVGHPPQPLPGRAVQPGFIQASTSSTGELTLLRYPLHVSAVPQSLQVSQRTCSSPWLSAAECRNGRDGHDYGEPRGRIRSCFPG